MEQFRGCTKGGRGLTAHDHGKGEGAKVDIHMKAFCGILDNQFHSCQKFASSCIWRASYLIFDVCFCYRYLPLFMFQIHAEVSLHVKLHLYEMTNGCYASH